jgi:hypothetical protein
MPVLKYNRMKSHLQQVLAPTGIKVTALTLHPRFLIVGTSTGESMDGDQPRLGRLHESRSSRMQSWVKAVVQMILRW